MLKALFLLFALAGTGLAQQSPVGIVTTATGDSKIFEPSSKSGRRAEIADILQPGARIVTGANGRVSFVSCSDGTAAQAQVNTELVFTAAGFELKRGSVGQTHKVPPCHVPVGDVAGPNAHIGGVNMRGETTMELLSPVGTAVDPSSLVFRWKPVDGATNYRVALRDGKGNDLWEAETNSAKTTLAYDSPTKLALGESYRWRVTALQGEDVLSSASAKVDTLSPQALARVAELRKQTGNSDEAHLLLGMLYEDLNAPDMALAEYQKVGGTRSQWLQAKLRALSATKK